MPASKADKTIHLFFDLDGGRAQTRCGARYPGGGLNIRFLPDSALERTDICQRCRMAERLERRLAAQALVEHEEHHTDKAVDKALVGTPGYKRRTLAG